VLRCTASCSRGPSWCCSSHASPSWATFWRATAFARRTRSWTPPAGVTVAQETHEDSGATRIAVLQSGTRPRPRAPVVASSMACSSHLQRGALQQPARRSHVRRAVVEQQRQRRRGARVRRHVHGAALLLAHHGGVGADAQQPPHHQRPVVRRRHVKRRVPVLRVSASPPSPPARSVSPTRLGLEPRTSR